MSEAYTAYRRPDDLGTPAIESDTPITLTVDGKDVTVPEGTTVIRAAVLAGINIPKLCATDSLEPFGSCRLCLVEIEGTKGLPASCTTEVNDGMKVTTQNDRLADIPFSQYTDRLLDDSGWDRLQHELRARRLLSGASQNEPADLQRRDPVVRQRRRPDGGHRGPRLQ